MREYYIYTKNLNEPIYLFDYGHLYHHIGYSQRELGQWEEASRSYQEAAEAYAGMAKADGTGDNHDDAVRLYNIACCHALSADSTGRIRGENGGRKQAVFIGAALDALRRAVKAGYRDANHAGKDSDLDVLRSREDFQTILMDMAMPVDPFVVER
jgi:hypothetical protein